MHIAYFFTSIKLTQVIPEKKNYLNQSIAQLAGIETAPRKRGGAGPGESGAPAPMDTDGGDAAPAPDPAPAEPQVEQPMDQQ